MRRSSGGPTKGKKGRGVAKAAHTSLVVGAVEVRVYQDKQGKRRERAGRLRLTLIPDVTEESPGTFLTQHVQTTSRIRTDGWKGYSDAAREDYSQHVRIVGSPPRAHKRFTHIHNVFGNLKTWLNGTHHGVALKSLLSYLDEFVFRFNRRQSPRAAFQTLLGIGLQKKPLTLENLRN